MSAVTQAVVLVGGRGTRLGSLTDQVPKPMLPVGGRPFLDYLLAYLSGQGVKDVVLSTGYLAQSFADRYDRREFLGLKLRVAPEEQPAGTGGALALLKGRLEEWFFALNGDTLFEVDFRQLAALRTEMPGASAVLALRQIEDAGRYGSVNLAGRSIRGFNEKSGTGAGLINGGIYCLNRKAIELLPAPPFSLERELFPQLAARAELAGCPFDGYFLDIGLPETLARAEREIPRRFPALNGVSIGG
jgi:NDP-sugar pyrophosphorylase family protein